MENIFGGSVADSPHLPQPFDNDPNDYSPFSLFGGMGTSIGQDDTMSGAMPTSSTVATGQPTMSGALQEPTSDFDSDPVPSPQGKSRQSSPNVLGAAEAGSKAESGSSVQETGVNETVISDSNPDASAVESVANGDDEEEEEEEEEEEDVDGVDEAGDEQQRAASVILGDERPVPGGQLTSSVAEAAPVEQPEEPQTPELTVLPRTSRSAPPKGKTASAITGSTAKRRRRTAADMLAEAADSFIQGDYSDRSKRHAIPRATRAAATPVKPTSVRKTKTVASKSASTPKARGRPKSDSTTKTPKSVAKEASAEVPKRRGRPPKNASETTTPAAKTSISKRDQTVRAVPRASPLKQPRAGRPAKTTPATVEAPKRRGRPPKNATAAEQPKSKGGRPRKTAEVTSATSETKDKAQGSTRANDAPAANASGQKTKAVTTNAIDPPKKRGRPPKATEATEAAVPSKKWGRAVEEETAPVETEAKRQKTGRQTTMATASTRGGQSAKKAEPVANEVKETKSRGRRKEAVEEKAASADAKEMTARGHGKKVFEAEPKPEPAKMEITRGRRSKAGKGEIATPNNESRASRQTKASASATKVKTGRVTKAKAPAATATATTGGA